MSSPYETPETTNDQKNEWSVTSTKSVEETTNNVSKFFEAEGYKLESGSSTDGVYGTGSNLMRVLFGAFAKRYCFRVVVREHTAGSAVVVEKGMSGAMGGAIGYSKMKKELARVREGVQAAI